MSERLPEDLEGMAPGPELFWLLSQVDRDALSDADRVRLARARHRLVSHVQAELYADLHACTRGEEPDEQARTRHPDASAYPWAEIEVAFALRWTRTAAGLRLELARQLREDLPRVWEALHRGDLDVPKVLVICELASWLADAAAARAVVDCVVERASGWTTGQLRARLRRLVLAADPGAARRRCAAVVGSRRVEVFDNDDGSGEVRGRCLAPVGVAAAWERLTAIARAAKAAGDPRTLDQLRADALVDLLVGEGVAVGGPVGCHTAGLQVPDEETSAVPSGEVVSGAPPAGGTVTTTLAGAAGASAHSAQTSADHAGTSGHRAGTSGTSGDPAPAVAFGQAPVPVRGQMPGPRRGVVELQVPLTTLMSLTSLPGELNGFGPVVADVARQVAQQHRDGLWRFSVYSEVGDLVCHGTTTARPTTNGHGSGGGDQGRHHRDRRPAAGDPIGVQLAPDGGGPGGDGSGVNGPGGGGPGVNGHRTARRPAARVGAFVRARNRTCIAPGCRHPARTCDLDHVVEWAHGGESVVDNLAPQCRMHHRFRHAPGTEVVGLSPGVFLWRTPRGLQYVSAPDPPLLDDDLFRLLNLLPSAAAGATGRSGPDVQTARG